MPKGQYSDQYVNIGFIELKNWRESVPQCMVCMKTSSNASMKPSLLQRHLQTNHLDKKDRAQGYLNYRGAKLRFFPCHLVLTVGLLQIGCAYQ